MSADLVQARRDLEASGVFSGANLRDEIASSWRRCLDRGMEPRSTPRDCVLGYREIYERKQASERHLNFARPEMELLSNQIAGSNYLIAFGDADGVVLDLLFDAQSEGTREARSIIQGSVWREDLRGTNALGLAGMLGRSITVRGGEHFYAKNAKISCLAAPIFRSNGSLAGVLNATSPASHRDRHTASLVNLAALNISNRIFVEDHRQELIVFCHPRQEYLATQSAGLLSFDHDGRMTGATPNARNILPDIAELEAPLFSDIFQDGYDRVFDSIHSGEAAQLRDRLGSSVFVRIRPTRGRLMGTQAPAQERLVSLPMVQTEEVQSAAVGSLSPRLDGFIDQQIAISADTIAARLPVRICGLSGSGLSEVARAVPAGESRCDIVSAAPGLRKACRMASGAFAWLLNLPDAQARAARIAGPLGLTTTARTAVIGF